MKKSKNINLIILSLVVGIFNCWLMYDIIILFANAKISLSAISDDFILNAVTASLGDIFLLMVITPIITKLLQINSIDTKKNFYYVAIYFSLFLSLIITFGIVGLVVAIWCYINSNLIEHIKLNPQI